MSTRNVLCSLFVLCCILFTCHGLIEDEIRTTIQNAYLDCRIHKNPGMVVSVVKDGHIVLSEAYGIKDKISQEIVTPNTMFGLGGISALFANILIVKKNAEYKKYNISMDEDTTLRNLFGREKIFRRSKLRSRYATTLDIMSHRLGIKNTPYLFLNDSMKRGDNVIDKIKHMKPRGRFRSSFYYNEFLYALMTNIGERLGKNNWEDLVRDEIFTPLGMTNSDFFTEVSPSTADIAKAYKDDEGSLYPVSFEFLKKWTQLCSPSCVLGSANDMAKFMIYLLGDGTIPGTNDTLISKRDQESLLDPHIRLKDPSIEDYFMAPKVPVSRTHSAFGMGIKRGMYNNKRILEVTDDLHGYNTMLTLFPDYKLGIFIAMTGEDDRDLFRTTLNSYIADKFLGDEPWLNSTTICTFPAPFMPILPPKSPKVHREVALGRLYEDFVGNYTNDIYGTAQIVWENGHLVFKYGFASFVLKREQSNSLKFNMFPSGLIEHMFSVDVLKFRERKGSSDIESFRVDKFDDAKFEKELPLTTTTSTTTTTTAAPPPPPPPPPAIKEKPAGGIAIPLK